MFIMNMALNFMFVYNPKKLQCENPNYPPFHVFTQEYGFFYAYMNGVLFY